MGGARGFEADALNEVGDELVEHTHGFREGGLEVAVAVEELGYCGEVKKRGGVSVGDMEGKGGERKRGGGNGGEKKKRRTFVVVKVHFADILAGASAGFHGGLGVGGLEARSVRVVMW